MDLNKKIFLLTDPVETASQVRWKLGSAQQ